MDIDRIGHILVSHAAGIGRRRAVAGLVAGAAATLRGQVSEAKKKKNKKTCKKLDTCPRRFGCVCADSTCFVAPFPKPPTDYNDECSLRCETHGGFSASYESPDSNESTLVCTLDGDVAGTPCPLV